MARIRYGKTFRTRRGRLGRYKYVNGRRVSFQSIKRNFNSWRRKTYRRGKNHGGTKMYYRR